MIFTTKLYTSKTKFMGDFAVFNHDLDDCLVIFLGFELSQSIQQQYYHQMPHPSSQGGEYFNYMLCQSCLYGSTMSGL